MELKHLIRNFQDFLVSSWPSISNLQTEIDWDSDPYFLDKWVEDNWRMLVVSFIGVEAGSCDFIYGYSNDLEQGHSIICKKYNHASEKYYTFLKLTSIVNSGIKDQPPYDFAAVYDSEIKKIRYLKVDELIFRVNLIP